ncbi:selenocysteine-specific translation elongation factor [Loigolactobacillus iwatensis]|uniref:selenocysteine-specific translation elongation factor n=1 Tax=Loigolactobacillus iwatensis TaxID=1267156 RepID=UPI000F7DE31D|nr:selenocysteine-specific translation elongation factor [Loigolactobacillus iwatensis]
MKHIVIATAGHVDHGKTTLIRALTGIETDTTTEEKKRGLTINLGFAFFDLPSKQRVGIVDVPGHEKFLKNMIAGLAGIDMVLLVVDAGEGVMPQTIEHAEILMLLGIKNFIIVLTKADTVDSEMQELAIDDVRTTFAGTILEKAPVVITDAVSGTGLHELTLKIDEMAKNITPPKSDGNPRLNVDRVFTLKGFGTIVTGTLLGGQVAINDELIAYPSEERVRIRNIQVHDQDEKVALPGQRTALNLNVKADQLSRGDVLTLLDNVEPTWMLDVQLQTLDVSDAALELQDRVRVYAGAKEVLGRIYPLGTEEVQVNGKTFVQIRLEEQIALKNGDRFVVRTYSPMKTIGGGVVLDANPRRHHRYDKEILQTLSIRATGDKAAILKDYLLTSEKMFNSLADIANVLDLKHSEAQKLLEVLSKNGKINKLGNEYTTSEKLQKLQDWLVSELQNFHQQFPLKVGLGLAEVRSKINEQTNSEYSSDVIDYLCTEKVIKQQAGFVSLYAFKPIFNPEQLKLKAQLEKELTATGFTPPSSQELTNGQRQAMQVLDALVGTTVVRLNDDVVISSTYYQKAVKLVTDFIQKNSQLSLADFRDITGSSRRYAMLILEKMDKDGITKRVENKRELR